MTNKYLEKIAEIPIRRFAQLGRAAANRFATAVETAKPINISERTQDILKKAPVYNKRVYLKASTDAANKSILGQ